MSKVTLKRFKVRETEDLACNGSNMSVYMCVFVLLFVCCPVT